MSYLLQQNLGILQTADQVKIGYGRFKLLKLRESAQITGYNTGCSSIISGDVAQWQQRFVVIVQAAAYMNSKYNTWKWGFQD